MQIHELTNTADLSSTDYVGVDNGTTTRRFDLGALIASIRNRLTNTETGITNLQTSVSDVQGDVADAQSDITGLGTRLDAAESSITSQGNRLTTAESDIDNLETKMTTAESNIATLQNNKVDMTMPLLNFDDTATDPLTDDGALANALRALDVLDDVIPSGGGALYLKKVLTKAIDEFNPKQISLTARTGADIAINGCYQVGKLVVVNVRLNVTSQFAAGSIILEGLPLPASTNPNAYVGVYDHTGGYNIIVNAQGNITTYNIMSTGTHTLNATYICR